MKSRGTVRWTSVIPPLSLLLSLVAALVLMGPMWDALPFLIAETDVQWIPAVEDLRPRRPIEGERIRTLRMPVTVVGTQARQYTITLDAVPSSDGPLGAMAPVTGPDSRFFINGVALETAALGPRAASAVATIPGWGFQRGANRVDLIVPGAAPYQWPRAIFVGPLAPLQAAGLHDALTQYWTTVAIVGFGLAASLIVWTGFDYRGEPTPFNRWPNISSQFGIMDTCGFRRTTTITTRPGGPTRRSFTCCPTGTGRVLKAARSMSGAIQT